MEMGLCWLGCFRDHVRGQRYDRRHGCYCIVVTQIEMELGRFFA